MGRVNLIFKWDEIKNERNHRKHKIWFEEATKVFSDPHLRVFYDAAHSTQSESRYLALGYSEAHRLLMVSHAFSHEIVRIISARKATKKERSFYEERI